MTIHKRRTPKAEKQPLDRLLKCRISAVLEDAIAAKAAACGITPSRYVRALLEHDTKLASDQPKPKPSRNRQAELLTAEVHHLAMQVKKLGTNINQMAKQSNAAMVPITRAEVVYMLNQHQILMSAAIAKIEQTLA